MMRPLRLPGVSIITWKTISNLKFCSGTAGHGVGTTSDSAEIQAHTLLRSAHTTVAACNVVALTGSFKGK
jgi:hypothetical protein